MPMVRDTLVALQRAQHLREKQLKETEQVAASRFLENYARKHDWTEEDLAEVKGALGL
jgi:hypothetical protein